MFSTYFASLVGTFTISATLSSRCMDPLVHSVDSVVTLECICWVSPLDIGGGLAYLSPGIPLIRLKTNLIELGSINPTMQKKNKMYKVRNLNGRGLKL